MTGCYLMMLPQQFMQGIANFEPDWPLSYHIARDVMPPPTLAHHVWLQLDSWHVAHHQLPSATVEVEPNLTAGGFLELLLKLQSIFLQLSAIFFARSFDDLISFSFLYVLIKANYTYRMLSYGARGSCTTQSLMTPFSPHQTSGSSRLLCWPLSNRRGSRTLTSLPSQRLSLPLPPASAP